jgi:3',5'-cyclic AMP phosphodiesterase CpdA
VRSALVLLVGFAMVAGGVGLALGVDGGLLPGIALAVLGLLVKGAGFLLGDPSSAEESGRRAQTLAGRRVERPRAGIPVGRATVRRRVPGRVPAAVVRPLHDPRVVRPTPAEAPQPRRRRRAS